MEPVRLGIVGTGVIGKAHLKAALTVPEKIDVVAVADLCDQARQEAKELGAKKTYCNDEELLADKRIEAVALAVPTGVRDPVAFKSLRRGKHMLVEKPPAMNAATIEQLIDVRKDLTAGCCSSRIAFQGAVPVVQELIANGKLGPVRTMRVRATMGAGKAPEQAPPPWRQSHALNGGGILVNWGVYDLNYLMEMTDWQLVPEVVLAQTWPVADVFADRVAPTSDADSYVTALIRCAGGEVINYERGEFMALHSESQWQIVGTDGSLTMTMHLWGENSIVHDDASAEEGVVSKTIWKGEDDGVSMMTNMYIDFAQAIREHRQPRTSLERAMVIQEIFDAIYASARRGVAVRIGDV